MKQPLLVRVRRRLSQKLSTYAGMALAYPTIFRIREKRYANALKRHQKTLRPLPAVAAQILSSLRSEGICRLPLEQLGVEGSTELICLGQRLVAQELDDFRLQAAAGRSFLMMRPGPILAHPALYLFGLSPLLLDIAEAYLGLPVAYDGVTIQYTLATGDEEATRLWHRDREDRKMLKIALYLNEVHEDGGPFELLPRTFESSGRKQRYFLTAAERLELEAGSLGTPISCHGPVGTAIFADTANFFHRGKPAGGRDRSAIFFSYFSHRPEHPFFCDRSGLPRSEIRRMVHALAPQQRDAALWRERLGFPLSLVPSFPIF